MQGISEAACKDLIQNSADGDGTVIGEELTRALLMDERGDRNIPVRRERGLATASRCKAFAVHVNQQGDDTLSTLALSKTRGFLIVLITASRRPEYEEPEKLRGKAISTRDRAKGKA